MFARFDRYLPLYYAGLCVLAGLALAWLLAVISGLLLDPGISPATTDRPAPAAPAIAPPADNGRILERNLFHSRLAPLTRPAAVSSAGSAASSRPAAIAGEAPANLTLIGTVAGSTPALAVIARDGQIGIYRPGETLPGAGRIEQIAPAQVLLRQADGSLLRLAFSDAPAASRPARAAVTGRIAPPLPQNYAIEAAGENRWRIAAGQARQLRDNIGQLLQQARLEALVVQGQTTGFVIRHIQAGTLLEQMGLKRGDVLRQVNGIPLDSPEKGLQIFQQLREAKSLRLALERQSQPLTFAYDIE